MQLIMYDNMVCSLKILWSESKYTSLPIISMLSQIYQVLVKRENDYECLYCD